MLKDLQKTANYASITKNGEYASELNNLGFNNIKDEFANQIRAAIYIYPNPNANTTISIREQIQACHRYIGGKHWILSDLFIEHKPKESLIPLIRSRAMAKAFDYVVSFANCTPMTSSNCLSGVIICCEAGFYFKKCPIKER